MREREGRIIFYSGLEGGYTLDEWLIHWTWFYLINEIDTNTFLEKIDYITIDMPGALENEDYNEFNNYLKLLAKQ